MAEFPTTYMFALFGGLAVMAAGLTRLMMRIGIIDRPNARSSHARPVPRSGGVAIVLSVYTGIAFLFLSSETAPPLALQMVGIGAGAGVLAIAGLLDDVRRLHSFKSKLAMQILGCLVLFPFGLTLSEMPAPGLGYVNLGWVGYPVTILWILGLTNIFNFMDGLDGLAAGTAVIVAVLILLLLGEGAGGTISAAVLILAASTFGFLVFNFPRAQIFLGDVGSQFLGFVFAALAVLAAAPGSAVLPILVVPLLFFHFIFDTIFTFCRRLRAAENVTQAHKSHLYQLLNQAGYSHTRVSILHFAITLAQGGGAYFLIRLPASQQWTVFVPFLVFEIVYAVLVLRIARRNGPPDRG